MALHKVEISPGQLRSRIAEDPHYTSLPWDYLFGLVERLYIFDIWVGDAGAVPMFIDEVTQDNNEGQAPYSEVDFDEIGKQPLFVDSYPEKPSLDATYPCRLRFFLHYVDPKATLDIADRHLALPAPTPLPEWLPDVMPYQPPN